MTRALAAGVGLGYVDRSGARRVVPERERGLENVALPEVLCKAGAIRHLEEKSAVLLDYLWSALPRTAARASEQRSCIPYIIHLVYGLWDEGGLPLRQRAMLGAWMRKHRASRWEIRLWGRKEADELLESRFPQLVDIYRGYPRPIQRADLLRYLLLLEFGGFYADLDLRCLRSLDGLVGTHPGAQMIVAVEKTLTPARAQEIGVRWPIRQGRPELESRIANYFLGCAARHPILAEIIELVRQRSHLPISSDYDVLYTTGPDVVSEIIHLHRGEPGLCILPEAEAARLLSHRCWGSWRER